MEYLNSILLVMGLFLLGVVSPGPNFLVVIQQSLSKGHKAGIVTGLGVALGDFLYAAAGLFGLAALIGLSGWLFGLIKFLGGAYMVYLGIKMIKNSRKADFIKIKKEVNYSLTKCFRLGIITDLANPKTIIFFASIFATTIKPDTPKWVLGGMLIGIVLTSITWRIGLSYMFSRNLFRVFYMKFRKWIEAAFGMFLILFGIKLTTSVIYKQ